MQLWIGLGNPGAKYAENRHNAGFMVVDAIAATERAAPWAKKFNALVTEVEINGEKILLIKPQQFMNLSGQAVGEAMRFYKLEPSAITVFHDELDLPLCKLRVKIGGGHGGHNGLRDVDVHIGKEYRRVRLGIDHPGNKDLVSPYVLSDFTASERHLFKKWVEEIAFEAPLLAAGKDSEFMTRIAR
jgi:PTH1 family peptidyl-tRNA hydrolase